MSYNDECRAARESALAMQTAPLTPAERAELRGHLAGCEACRAAIGRLDDLIDAASTLDDEEWGGDVDASFGQSDADDLFARIESAIADDAATEDDGAAAAIADEPGTGGAQVIAFPAAAITAQQGASDLDTDAERVADDGEADGAPSTRWWAGVGLLLAALLVGAFVWSLDGPDTAPEDNAQLATADDPANVSEPSPQDPDERAVSGQGADELAAALPEIGVPTLVPALDGAVAAAQAVNVFASDSAQWSLSDGPEFELLLRSGAVLVEFVGDGSESLTLRTADWSVHVVGTSFYADADGELDVRVHTGAVDVRVADTAAPERVVAGEAFAGAERRALSETERAAFGRWVNPADHERALQARRADPRAQGAADPGAGTDIVAAAAPSTERAPSARAAAPDVPNSRAPSRNEPPSPSANVEAVAAGDTPDTEAGADFDPAAAEGVDTAGTDDDAAAVDPAALLAGARAAQRSRQWAQAADQYETWLDQSAASSQAGAVRLDVARIYLDRLRDPSRAMGHLEAFVAQYPDDVAAPAARAELCRIAMSMGREVASCAP